jgi:putative transposase
VRLEFIRPGKPVENAFIESFNGRLRDACLNAHVFASTIDAPRVLEAWRHDDNHIRPHSALKDRTPVETGTRWVDSRVPREATAMKNDGPKAEIAGRFVTISPY